MSSIDNIREASRKSYVAWNTGDLDLLDEVFATDVKYHLASFPDMDLAGLKQTVAATRVAQPDFEVREDEYTREGDVTCSRWTCSATFTAENSLFPGVEPTGKGQTSWGVVVTHWRDGKGVEVWHAWDSLGWLTQQGIIPPMGLSGP